jgi:hypothetical protein
MRSAVQPQDALADQLRAIDLLHLLDFDLRVEGQRGLVGIGHRGLFREVVHAIGKAGAKARICLTVVGNFLLGCQVGLRAARRNPVVNSLDGTIQSG